MINFKDTDGFILLTIEDYEFTRQESDDFYDDNWLNVCVTKKTFDGTVIKNIDPAIFSWDLEKIKVFFESEQVYIIEFMEPELTFRREKDLIILDLRYNLRFDKSKEVNHCYLNESAVNFAEKIDFLIKKFPVRKTHAY